MTPLERLCGAAHGGAVDRPPCICPGGMMNGVVEDVMLKTGIYWPKAHCDAQMMADLSRARSTKAAALKTTACPSA